MKLTDISTAQDMGIELEIAEGLQAGLRGLEHHCKYGEAFIKQQWKD